MVQHVIMCWNKLYCDIRKRIVIGFNTNTSSNDNILSASAKNNWIAIMLSFKSQYNIDVNNVNIVLFINWINMVWIYQKYYLKDNNIFKWIFLTRNNHITSWCYVLIKYINNNNIFLITKLRESVQNCNKLAIYTQLLIEQTPKFVSFVQDTIERVSATRNNLNTFWSLGDHSDPRNQNFSYNELCGANNPTISLFQQVKLVLH